MALTRPVDHDQLDGRVRLRQHTGQRLPDHGRHVAANGDEGDTHWCKERDGRGNGGWGWWREPRVASGYAQHAPQSGGQGLPTLYNSKRSLLHSMMCYAIYGPSVTLIS